MAEKKTEMVEIPKAEYDEMVRINQENAAMMESMVGGLDEVRTAQLAGTGIDPRIMARSLLPRVRVQFLKHYNRAAVPSKIQKGALIIEAYSVEAGDIVDISKDEFDRIMAEFPDKMEADEKKFRDKPRKKPVQVMDKDTGRMKVDWVKDNLKLKDLLNIAVEVG